MPVTPSFYIFKGEKIREDYIQQCKPRSCMEMLKKNMDDMLFVQAVFFFFIRSILRGLSQQNRHFLILDGHGSHVTLKAIK
jgi:hypothetical protein